MSIRLEPGARLGLTWRSGDREIEEVVELATEHAAAEAFELLSRLAPAARTEALVRNIIKTAPKKPRGGPT